MSLTYGSMCSGYGGLEQGVQSVLGGETLWHVEFDKAPSKILEHHWPGVPNYGDLTKTDWHKVPRVHILSAGYPCQPFSHAGKRLGTDDPRHLWPHIANAVAILRPPLLVFENVRGHLSLGFDEVVRDLHQLGYDVTWYMLRASNVGAAHGRARLFIFGRNRGKCGVCGRTDRRGGLDWDNEQGQGQYLRDQPQGLHVGHGAAGAEGAGVDSGWQGDPRPGRHGHQAPDVALATDGEEGRRGTETHGASSAGEARAGADSADAHGDDRSRADGPRRRGEVDARNVRAGCTAAQPDQAPEPTWAGPGTARREAAGDLSLGGMVGAGGRSVRPGGVPREVPDVRPDGGRACLCDELVGGAHGRFRIFLFATPADAGGLGGLEAVERHGRGMQAVNGSGVPHESDRDPLRAGPDGGLTLLPTPAVNDMGAAYTPETWDAWTERMKSEHGNGNGHGKSLSIEAQRLLPTPVADNSRGLPSSTTDYASLANVAAALLPTPRATDGTKGGPNQRGSSGDLMLPSAVQKMQLLNGIAASRDWREYEAAIRRHEAALGRPAPTPTEPGAKGQPRLSPKFVEWLMMLPDGWVTDVPGISRNDQLKALGNGVVVPQAAAATRAFLHDTAQEAVA